MLMRLAGTGKPLVDEDALTAPVVPLPDKAGEGGACKLGEFGRGLSLYLGDDVAGFANI